MVTRQRLTKRDWTTAALAALTAGGVTAVAIEPLAASLGATKGSAYWHFRNREALLTAALERWEAEATTEVIAEMDRNPDPLLRLSAAARVVLTYPVAAPGGTGAAVRRR